MSEIKLPCPKCREETIVVNSGFPGLAFAKILYSFFGYDPDIYICSECGYEHDPAARKKNMWGEWEPRL